MRGHAGGVRPVSVVRDPSLAPSGRRKIDWAARHMPVLASLARELEEGGELRGRRLALCLHLEAKTARLAEVLHQAGAEVSVAGSNPLSTQDDVAAALAEEGVEVFAWRGATPEEYREFLERALSGRPELVIDDGADLIGLLHGERRDLLGGVRGAAEETTTGIRRIRALEAEGLLAFPVMATNDGLAKHLFDNRYGTGQSVWDAIMRTTNLTVAGKTVVVLGYGWCGKGVAARAAGLGAHVVVCEVDPVRANEALMDGFRVMPSLEAAAVGELFVTVTGMRDVLRREHFERMRDGAVLANAGHFDVEIAKPDLAALAVRREEVRPHVEGFVLADGRRLYLLAEGRLVNLAAGDGHPVEIMDLSFSLQVEAIRYVDRHADELGRRLVPIPRELDERVLGRRLEALGVRIDRLTPEQEAYGRSWRV
ncbi:MAG: adenosylhomocysteinase [Clostridia bacterium]|nr:adenosylhomocysteinase [Clostridia bacterium]